MALRKLPATQKEWFEIALFYCSKRETSRPKLKLYLTRKLKELKPDEDTTALALTHIEGTLTELERLKIIDHERYAGMLTREYARRGKGARYVARQLHLKGVKEEIPNMVINPEEEFERAVQLVQKQLKRSNFQKLSDPWEIKSKLMQKLLAAGFELSAAKRAIELALKLTGER